MAATAPPSNHSYSHHRSTHMAPTTDLKVQKGHSFETQLSKEHSTHFWLFYRHFRCACAVGLFNITCFAIRFDGRKMYLAIGDEFGNFSAADRIRHEHDESF
jgi:hypothetical protein